MVGWFVGLWHINSCRLFIPKSCFYIYVICLANNLLVSLFLNKLLELICLYALK